MPTYSAAASAAAVNARTGLVNAGAAAPKLIIYTDAYASVLIEFPLDNTDAFEDPSVACPAVATAAGLPRTATATGTGTAGAYRVINGDAAMVVEGTGASEIGITGAGRPVELSTLGIITGQDFDLTNLQFTQPCS